ncbi:MAG TPA: helix-turn-helix transcriptional regulator [Gemmatimonadaceae bacterium]|nr:helix-turn-helix transcriptional regulator [Gemmatimonadaceae bacterium]
MSTELSGEQEQLLGTPELAPIGKRIEMLRIERGISKQQLAKAAGISRQQLWRVLAGKSELTSSLRERLAFVLRTDAAVLQRVADEPAPAPLATWFGGVRPDAAMTTTMAAGASVPASTSPLTFLEFVATTTHVQGLLAALPSCDSGLALKRAVLDSIEDVAMARGIALPIEFFELRRAVITRAL